MTIHIEMQQPVDWGTALSAPIKYDDLQLILDSVQLGVEQARRGEGRILEEKDLPVDDD